MICLNKICNSPIFEKLQYYLYIQLLATKGFLSTNHLHLPSNFFSILVAWKQGQNILDPVLTSY